MINKKDYDEFVEKLEKEIGKDEEIVCFQTNGLSNEYVRKLWRKYKRENGSYSHIRAKKIDGACIFI